MLTEASGFESGTLSGMVLTNPPAPRQKLAARDIAREYEEYIEGLWRGEPTAPVFSAWLTPFWRKTLPPAPRARPDAISPQAAGGRGIHWYDTADAVIGYVDGTSAGYRIPWEKAIPTAS